MFYRLPSARSRARASRRLAPPSVLFPLTLLLLILCAPAPARAQLYEHEVDAPGPEVSVRVRNRTGRVSVVAEDGRRRVAVRATTTGMAVSEREVRIAREGGAVSVEVGREGGPAAGGRKFAGSLLQVERERIDVVVRVPARARVRVETEAGAVDLTGNVAEAAVTTDTGTIRADVPLDALRYHFRWTLARPRFFSEVTLPEVRQKRGGAYEISGRFGDQKAKREERVELDLETARGVLLFGVTDESNVPSDLRERELTEAARAVIRSGDAELTDAIRKVAPRLVGEYAATLPPRQTEPQFAAGGRSSPFDVRTPAGPRLARLNARVTDRQGRAIPGLSAADFAVVEDGVERPVREVTPASAPFNLVLLVDVSGSVEERLDFIRKAALDFVNTAGPQDRIAVVSFRDDVQLISDFTSDRRLLTERIKDIQAGGATALYDALAYSLVNTLKPLRGERTGVVILSDGDDNRSFLSLPPILDALYETGAVVFPVYLPSGLIPAAVAPRSDAALDPVRTRFLTLTSRAGEEGRRLAEVSGGTYYPVTRLEQLQRAYDDVAAQLRTSYTITYESGPESGPNPRVRVRVARDGATVRLSPAVGVTATKSAPPAGP